MRQIFDGTKKIPHPEEAAKRPSRRTRDADPASLRISSQPRKRGSRASGGAVALGPRFRGDDNEGGFGEPNPLGAPERLVALAPGVGAADADIAQLQIVEAKQRAALAYTIVPYHQPC